ncbi:MAG: sulfotransferase family protein [Limisphaerales bacterium]
MSESPVNPSGNAPEGKVLLSNKRPDFFVVGAPKCGTTALAQYLARHPKIYMPRKEMHFFGSDLHFGPNFYRRNRQAYLDEFAQGNDRARVGEASVWYLFSMNAAAEIKAFSPEASIIILLRNPVFMLYSLYYQFLFDGNEYLLSFEEALEAEHDRCMGRRIGRLTYLSEALAYRSTARFTDQVRRYFDIFGRERVHVIIYDDLAADTAGAYRGTLEFLGVPGCPCLPESEVVGNSSVRSSALRAVLNDPLVRGTAIALRRWLPPPLFRMIQKAGTGVISLNQCAAKRPPMSPAIRLSLQREFAPEVERLSALLGRDLTHWSRPEATPAESPAKNLILI